MLPMFSIFFPVHKSINIWIHWLKFPWALLKSIGQNFTIRFFISQDVWTNTERAQSSLTISLRINCFLSYSLILNLWKYCGKTRSSWCIRVGHHQFEKMKKKAHIKPKLNLIKWRRRKCDTVAYEFGAFVGLKWKCISVEMSLPHLNFDISMNMLCSILSRRS